MRATSSESLFNSIKDINFFRGGVKVTIEEIFEAMYSGVDGLLNYNALQRSRGRIPDRVKQTSLIGVWKEEIEQSDLSAKLEIVAPTGDFVIIADAQVRARNNFDKNRERRPSIIELTDSLGNVLYVRRQAIYKTSSIFSDFFHFSSLDPGEQISRLRSAANANRVVKTYLSVVDESWYRKFISDGSIDRIHKVQGQPYHKPYVFIPEPHLVKILEQMYSEGVPRVTPRTKVIEETNNAVYVTRPSLSVMIDRALDRDMMAKLGWYFGVLHALGLTDFYDRQLEHYAIQTFPLEDAPDGIVNYDPDFIVLDRRRAKSRQSPLSIDAKLVQVELNDEYAISAREFESFREGRREAIKYMVKLIGEEDLNYEIYRRLKPSLRDYVPML
ncbi:hypothetical protein HYX12_01775 [Candidatus Woesearchaeota archaeon]|nr:hypothetical protein [Candidatus Woesearchaeota archaeon]